MSVTPLLPLVDDRTFRKLFIEELGWNNPDRPQLQCDVDGMRYSLTQVAGYRGLRIWVCDTMPDKKTQREIDKRVGQDNLERLVIFVGTDRQEWRWPRRAQTGGVNAKLLVHRHLVGHPDPHLDRQLRAIEIDLDSAPSLVDLLSRMRAAFDVESETASVQAARLMGILYGELHASKVGPDDATLLLARLLFLLFGDDSGMWNKDLFHGYLVDHTGDSTLHTDLAALFSALNTVETERHWAPGSPLGGFRYINGGLFEDQLGLPPLTSDFRTALLSACDFDWQVISPAVFGSMFQTVKDKEARRHGGEHYTTEENILKTIGPLFLDELRDKLQSAWNGKGQLTTLHNELGRLRFLDPACGCGNFLVVAYRELRALELELLKRRRDLDEADGRSAGRNLSQTTLDVTSDIKVTLDHFYGIEIGGWPARIAETAMLLVDHLANQRMEEDFGLAPDRLPIRLAPTIVHRNALHIDWRDVLPPSNDVIIVGNPPFIGQYTKTVQQTADTKRIWGSRYNGYLDYVTCWHARAIDYYGKHSGRWSFVSTNSVCQGEAVEFLWRPILTSGWRCRFAHRSFRWVTEAPGGAGVHVSILGFDRLSTPKPILWTYGEDGRKSAIVRESTRINPYLVADAPIVLVSSRTEPISKSLPPVEYGNKPTDGGNLFVERADLRALRADPIATKYVRRFVGARELLYNLDRWCLWLEDAAPSELQESTVLRMRIEAVRKMRSDSTKPATNRKAAIPHLFDERRQPTSSYLAIPAHVGENREYFTAARFDASVICGNANFMVADPDGLVLGILSSTMFIQWMRAIGGRLESRLRFSNTFSYNTFPLPNLSIRQRGEVAAVAAGISRVRSEYGSQSLAALYEPEDTPPDLLHAHAQVDRVVDRIFGVRPEMTPDDRQRLLFRRYAAVTGQDTLECGYK